MRAQSCLTICSSLLLACTPDADTRDSARADSATGDVAMQRGDSAMDSATAAAARGPARDANHEFIRKVVDHHESMIQMADLAFDQGGAKTTRDDGARLRDTERAEQRDLLDMAQSEFQEELRPVLMPRHRTMLDSLRAATGSGLDAAFYRHAASHHREGVRMLDDMMPRLTNDSLRRMATEMKTRLQRELQEFERKAKGAAMGDTASRRP